MSTHELELSGHVAIVTGANRGIGAAIARGLAAEGAAVILAYFRLEDEVTDTTPTRHRTARASTADDEVNRILEQGGRAASVEADLRDVATPAKLFDFAERQFGPVDILINNATGWVADTFKATSVDRLERRLTPLSAETLNQVFEVDARGSGLMIAEFAKRHCSRGATWGRIVGLSSGGPDGFPEEVSYGAAKAALENLTMSAGFELADRGITANVVRPPVTDTGWVTPAVEKAVNESDDLFHIAQPEQVAAIVSYLCSNEAELITANVLQLR
jgi:3-oxoacyl-[acyl-carrier protein] reductase